LKNRIMKVGRNDPCPCGSGFKYKKCCLGKETFSAPGKTKNLYFRKYQIHLKEEEDLEAIKKAGRGSGGSENETRHEDR
jgi:methionyl aminopeptidase